jgi:hypothetical protein
LLNAIIPSPHYPITQNIIPNAMSSPSSKDLAQYIEQTDGISKPWLLVQLRLAKLKERRGEMTDQEYTLALDDIQQDLMKIGQWWKGREQDVFGDQ